jgi:hypothetical protein
MSFGVGNTQTSVAPTGLIGGDDTAPQIVAAVVATASPGSASVSKTKSVIGSSQGSPWTAQTSVDNGTGDNARPTRSVEGGIDEDVSSDHGRQHQNSRTRVEEALETAQKEGEYSYLMRSGNGGGFDATSKTVHLSDAVGDGGGSGEVLLDMGEVRDALCSLAVARGELLALAAASPD